MTDIDVIHGIVLFLLFRLTTQGDRQFTIARFLHIFAQLVQQGSASEQRGVHATLSCHSYLFAPYRHNHGRHLVIVTSVNETSAHRHHHHGLKGFGSPPPCLLHRCATLYQLSKAASGLKFRVSVAQAPSSRLAASHGAGILTERPDSRCPIRCAHFECTLKTIPPISPHAFLS